MMIRQANRDDAERAILLICEAGGDITHTLAGTHDDGEIVRILVEFFRQEDNRVSHRNTLVAERNGVVVGALVSYHGSRSEELDRPFLARQRAEYGRVMMEIAREARPDEYYLDSLAVVGEARGQGIATALLAEFEAAAQRQGHTKVALLAEESNEPAFRLYCKTGYITNEIIHIHGHDYHHMVKILSAVSEKS
jgi:ribosomal protein S18 acetylase RimI-like enzyme